MKWLSHRPDFSPIWYQSISCTRKDASEHMNNHQGWIRSSKSVTEWNPIKGRTMNIFYRSVRGRWTYGYWKLSDKTLWRSMKKDTYRKISKWSVSYYDSPLSQGYSRGVSRKYRYSYFCFWSSNTEEVSYNAWIYPLAKSHANWYEDLALIFSWCFHWSSPYPKIPHTYLRSIPSWICCVIWYNKFRK